MITEKKGKVYGRDLPDEEEKREEKLDLKLPFDMKSFWKNINEKYFRKYDQFSQNEVTTLSIPTQNTVSHILTDLDFQSDQVFTKSGFPKTVNCLVGKSGEPVSSKGTYPFNTLKFYYFKFNFLLKFRTKQSLGFN